jgi:hypothetical protein
MRKVYDLTTGKVKKFPSLPPTPQVLTERDYMNTAQSVMDSQAQSMGYDNIFTAISYIGDPYKRFNDEAVAIRNYRSLVWQHSNDLMAKVLAGKIAQPTLKEYEKGLPDFTL